MKPENIVEGKSYEVTMGKSPNAVVTVIEKNLVTKTWFCSTAEGREINIKNPDRFVKSVKTKEPKPVVDEPVEPQEKPKKEKAKNSVEAAPASDVDPDTAKRLRRDRADALKRLHQARAAFEYGWVKEAIVKESQEQVVAANEAMQAAGLRAEKTGRANGQMSGKDAAYQVLLDEGKPLRAMEIYNLATARNYCDLTGATPWSTISASLTTDIATKGERSKFKKAGTGLFAVNENYTG